VVACVLSSSFWPSRLFVRVPMASSRFIPPPDLRFSLPRSIGRMVEPNVRSVESTQSFTPLMSLLKLACVLGSPQPAHVVIDEPSCSPFSRVPRCPFLSRSPPSLPLVFPAVHLLAHALFSCSTLFRVPRRPPLCPSGRPESSPPRSNPNGESSKMHSTSSGPSIQSPTLYWTYS
jgi:hypothetical protein